MSLGQASLGKKPLPPPHCSSLFQLSSFSAKGRNISPSSFWCSDRESFTPNEAETKPRLASANCKDEIAFMGRGGASLFVAAKYQDRNQANYSCPLNCVTFLNEEIFPWTFKLLVLLRPNASLFCFLSPVSTGFAAFCTMSFYPFCTLSTSRFVSGCKLKCCKVLLLSVLLKENWSILGLGNPKIFASFF